MSRQRYAKDFPIRVSTISRAGVMNINLLGVCSSIPSRAPAVNVITPRQREIAVRESI